MRVVYTEHAKERMAERGVSEGEVVETIDCGDKIETEVPRQVRRRVFTSGYRWRGARYLHKEVTVVYVREEGETIVLTSIARYGEWEVSE